MATSAARRIATPAEAPARAAASTDAKPAAAKPSTTSPRKASTRAVNAVADQPRDSISKLTTVTERDYVACQKLLTDYAKGKGRHTGGGCGQKQSGGAWSRGLLQVRQDRVGAGSLITVYSGHDQAPDKFASLKLRLELKPSGQSWNQQYDLVSLGTDIATKPGKGPYKYESVLKFYVADKAVEAAIKEAVPGTTVASALKNGRFAVHGNWQSGHNWGNFDRDGVFPFKTGAGEVKQAEAKIVVGMPPGQQNIELDVSVPISAALQAKYPALKTKNAIFVSHLEAEGKARVPLTRFTELMNKLLLAASTDPKDAADKAAAAKAIFGAEAGIWTIDRVKKYDPEGVAMAPDQHGLIPVNPFNDIYLDNNARQLTEHGIALRIRTVAGEKNSFTQINYKPGPGVRSTKTNVSNRVEAEIICAGEVFKNPHLLLPFLNDKDEPLNPHNLGSEFVRQKTGAALPARVATQKGTEITNFSSIGSNRRFKFEFHNTKTLVAFETSLDLCATLCLDARGLPVRVDADGKPDPKGQFFAMSVFAQVEPEANHMQGAVGGNAPAPKSPSAKPPASAQPAASGAAQSAVAAPTTHIHGLQDLSSPVFKTDPGYAQFEKVMPSFQEWLFGADIGTRAGAMLTDQKNAIGQRLAGMVKLTPEEKRLYAQELAATAQFRASASAVLADAVQKAEADIAAAKTKFRGMPQMAGEIEKATAKAREAVWAAFGKINPLDHVDLTKLPKP